MTTPDRCVVMIVGAFKASTPWEVENNVRKAEEVALAFWRGGYAVVCPHTNSRFFFGAAPEENFLEGYQAILARVDAIVILPGYGESPGSCVERLLARELGKPIYYYDGGNLAEFVAECTAIRLRGLGAKG